MGDMRAANVSRLLERLGPVPDDLMAQVNAKLRMHLGGQMFTLLPRCYCQPLQQAAGASF